MLLTGIFKTNSSMSLSDTENCPFGLFQSLAIFAKNLFEEIPAEAVIPKSSEIFWRICSAIFSGSPSQYLESDTSK